MGLKPFLLTPADYLKNVFFESGPSAAMAAFSKNCRLLESVERTSENELWRSFQEEKPLIIGKLIGEIIGARSGLSTAAHRNDWLYLYEKTVTTLNYMSWLGVFLLERFHDNHHNWYQTLYDFCELAGCEEDTRQVFLSSSAKDLAHHVNSILVHTLDWFQSNIGDYEETWLEHGMRDEFSKPDAQPSSDALENNSEALDMLESALRATPGYIGTLTTGSFGVANHQDCFSDLDVAAVFDGDISNALRDDLQQRLDTQPCYRFRFGVFENVPLKVANIHMMFFNKNDIQKALDKFLLDGAQVTTIDFSSEERNRAYTPPAHRWVTGLVHSDSNNVLSTFKEQYSVYPERLRKARLKKWSSIWRLYSQRFEDDREHNDPLGVFSSLFFCTNAVMRILLAQNSIHTEEFDTKWLCKDFEDLASKESSPLTGTIGLLPSDFSESPRVRYEKLQHLWGITQDSCSNC